MPHRNKERKPTQLPGLQVANAGDNKKTKNTRKFLVRSKGAEQNPLLRATRKPREAVTPQERQPRKPREAFHGSALFKTALPPSLERPTLTRKESAQKGLSLFQQLGHSNRPVSAGQPSRNPGKITLPSILTRPQSSDSKLSSQRRLKPAWDR